MKCLLIGVFDEAASLLAESAPACAPTRLPYDLDQLADLAMDAPALIVCGPPPEGVSVAEVAQLLRMQFQGQPILLVAPEEARFDRQELLKNGMTDVFFFPLDRDLYRRAVAEAAAATGDGRKVYRAVKLLDLQPDTLLEFDTFIYLPANNKHIRYSSGGETLDGDRLARLRKHNMSSVFVNPTDLPKVYAYAAKTLRELGRQGIGETERAERLHGAARELISGLFSDAANGTDGFKRVLGDCREIVRDYVKIGATGDLFSRIESLAGGGKDSYSRAANTSTYAALFAIGLGMGEGSVDELALAGLLHDIGLAKIPPALQSKPIFQMSPLELKTYSQHPEFAISMIRERRMVVPEGVHRIILQHHEQFNGGGFPKGLRGNRICAEAQILAFADRFDELTAITPGTAYVSASGAAREISKCLAADVSKCFIDPDLLRRILALFPAEEGEMMVWAG